jgi:osmotically-inducible protein OsmY
MPLKITDSLQATDIPNQSARNLACNRCFDELRVCMTISRSRPCREECRRRSHAGGRRSAERAVQNLWGVRGVFNNITLSALPPTTAVDVKTKIESAFRRHAQLDADAIRVSVEDGTLILSGDVHNLRERSDAEAAAWAAPGGVRKVDNRIHVQL